jgi:hypothetical protein
MEGDPMLTITVPPHVSPDDAHETIRQAAQDVLARIGPPPCDVFLALKFADGSIEVHVIQGVRDGKAEA